MTAPRTVRVELSGASAEVVVPPQRKWTVYVVRHSHLDIGYTDRQGVVPADPPVSLVDARTGGTVPHEEEAVRPEDWPTRPAGRRLRFVLPDVAAGGRFAEVGHPLVRIAAIGPSRRGHDLVAYLASVSAAEVTAPLRVPGLRAALVGTSLERDLRPLEPDGETVAVPVPASGLVAVSIDLAGGPAR